MDERANVDGSVIGNMDVVGNGEEKVPSADGVVEGGKDEGEDEGEADEGDEEEQEGEGNEEEEEEEDNGGEQRPKLAEGFYEIEAVRRRRVCKGEVQYLIKWRGWPETANTWEPLENLLSCVDVVEAFEENLQLGKSRSSRKRKRRIPRTQPRMKHQSQSPRSTFTAYDSGLIENGVNYKFRSLKSSTILEDAVPLQIVRFGLNEVTKSDSRDLVPKQSAEKVARNSSRPFSIREEESGYVPKLGGLRGGTCYNGFAKDSSTRNFREANGSGRDEPSGTTRIDSVEPGQSAPQVGSKKRKCNSVKRFKQETAASSSTTQNGFSTTAYNMKTEINSDKGSPIITKIIKPIVFSDSIANNIQDVSVTFMAMRSDGKEVMVDNNFLKANYPLLLINFYEQHLRYSPTS